MTGLTTQFHHKTMQCSTFSIENLYFVHSSVCNWPCLLTITVLFPPAESWCIAWCYHHSGLPIQTLAWLLKRSSTALFRLLANPGLIWYDQSWHLILSSPQLLPFCQPDAYVIFVFLLTPAPFSWHQKHTNSRFVDTKMHKIQDFRTKTH